MWTSPSASNAIPGFTVAQFEWCWLNGDDVECGFDARVRKSAIAFEKVHVVTLREGQPNRPR
jgi:hypothetical protein